MSYTHGLNSGLAPGCVCDRRFAGVDVYGRGDQQTVKVPI